MVQAGGSMQIERICPMCGKTFNAPHWRPEAKYCSPECRQKNLRAKPNLKCAACGKMFHRKPYAVARLKANEGYFCCLECAKVGMKIRMSGARNHQYGLKGRLNASFKGDEISHGNHNNTDIMVYKPEHPFCCHDGRVLKHRLIVEQNAQLFDQKWFVRINEAMYLKKETVVHHIDGNHNNNDVSNLQILSRGEHTSIHNKARETKRDNATGRYIKRTL